MNYSKINQIEDNVDVIANNAYKALHLLHHNLVNLPGLSILHHDLAILSILAQGGPLPTTEVARRLSLTKPQMTQFIDRLTADNLVTREGDPSDRRRVLVKITAKGKSELAGYRQLVRKNISDKLKALSPGEIDALVQSLTQIINIGQKLE
jgi:DNA-binding MarR family transcriptional regulator